MNIETKELLRSIGINAAGTVLGAGAIALVVFISGKINLVAIYWKEILLSLLFIFTSITLSVWFRKLVRLEKQLSNIQNQPKISLDYSSEIKKIEKDIKAELVKKADRDTVPSKADFKELRRTVKELEIYKYGQKGQMGELITLIELLKEDIDENHWGVENVLVELEKKIGGIKLEGDQITDIEEQLHRLIDKPKYNFLIAKIRKHY